MEHPARRESKGKVKTILFVLLGYCSGSVLFADLAGSLFGKKELLQKSEDKNPGTVNAFRYCGFWCGIVTLLGDLAKGMVPVRLYIQQAPQEDWALALILAAPVLGHAFPLFRRFQGGKGVAVTFGVLLGLCPYALPVTVFAAIFIVLSTVLRVEPTFQRTALAYLLTAAILGLKAEPAVRVGFLAITAVVCLRLHMSPEPRERLEIKPIWIR